MLEIDAELFAAVPDISLDYAVMEKAAGAGEVAVVRGTFDWSDIGSWQAVADLAPPDAQGNHGQGERVAIATKGTYVNAGDRLVATVGVENLVIVDTPDAVLVAHRDHLQRVKEVVGELKARGHESYRLHKTVARPWGAYTVLQEGPGFKIKRIEVKSGAALSLQLHHRRSEHWVVVAGVAKVTRGDETFDVGQTARRTSLSRPAIDWRIRKDPLVMIEVQCGDYLGEDDIVRFDDKYGRVPAEGLRRRRGNRRLPLGRAGRGPRGLEEKAARSAAFLHRTRRFTIATVSDGRTVPDRPAPPQSASVVGSGTPWVTCKLPVSRNTSRKMLSSLLGLFVFKVALVSPMRVSCPNYSMFVVLTRPSDSAERRQRGRLCFRH